jgi:hypothetical protein
MGHSTSRQGVHHLVIISAQLIYLNASFHLQIHVEPAAIKIVRDLYAPPDHPVFQLVPPTFDQLAKEFYQTMGQPVVTRGNVWDVYLALLNHFHQLDEAHANYHNQWKAIFTENQDENLGEIELLEGLEGLRGGQDIYGPDGSYYMGGVNNGAGLGEWYIPCVLGNMLVKI